MTDERDDTGKNKETLARELLGMVDAMTPQAIRQLALDAAREEQEHPEKGPEALDWFLDTFGTKKPADTREDKGGKA